MLHAAAGSAAAIAILQPASPARADIGMEPNAIKRRGVGLRGYDPARSFQGFTLFAPSFPANKTVYLVDMEGKVVHTWTMPYPPGSYGYLTPQGRLFYNGKIPDPTHLGQAAFKGGAALEVDWSGKVLLEVKESGHHHDGIDPGLPALAGDSGLRGDQRRDRDLHQRPRPGGDQAATNQPDDPPDALPPRGWEEIIEMHAATSHLSR